ncbi:retrovirus-related pol polyprotein from transposon TNT 1-94, partial [Tanacetum coccineum]
MERCDAGKKNDEDVCKESRIDDQERPENSTQDVNTVGPSINTKPDMFSLGDNATLEATHADFFGDETEVNMSNITTTYLVPSTLNTRIHKDHSLDHMDVNSAFLYGRIEEEVYVCQPPGFEDPDYPDKVYRVVKALYGLHQAPRAWLQVKQKVDEIFISQDKYVAYILRKFSFTDVRTASTPIDTKKPLLKDSDGDDVDVHLYRSIIGSLMYLTSSRPYIMFAVCACARFQVTPKVSHLHAVKKIFSDYARASLDMKSTTG